MTKKVMEVVVGRNQDQLVWPDNCVSKDEGCVTTATVLKDAE